MDSKKIVKYYNEWKWAFLLLAICIIGIPLTTIYGIQSVNWGNDFWPNALSEFLGMFVDLLFGAVFTFVVIDKYLKYHKNKQWRKIEHVVYKNLYFTLSSILIKLNHAFPKEMRVESYVVNEDIETLNDYLPKSDFEIFTKSLTKNIDKLIEESSSHQLANSNTVTSFTDEHIHSSLIKFKQNSKSDITTLSSLIVPKLLNFSDDTDLLDDVIELEDLFASLMAKIKNVHSQNQNQDNEIKYIWLLKIQEILKKIDEISNFIQDDISID